MRLNKKPDEYHKNIIDNISPIFLVAQANHPKHNGKYNIVNIPRIYLVVQPNRPIKYTGDDFVQAISLAFSQDVTF